MNSEFSADLQLSGKTVIVTGAARGIGDAIARAFGLAKANVLIVDRMRRPDGQTRADRISKEIAKSGGRALVMRVDISERAQVERMVDSAIRNFGRIDVLVCNAAIMKGGYLVEMDEMNLQEHLDVNVKGTFNCCQLVAKQMIRQGDGGKIIILSSIDGMYGNEGEVAYSMSKAALILLMKCMAIELAPYKINVNAIAPGWVETDMTVPHLNDELIKEIRKQVPAGSIAKPEQIAGGALFLASPLSDYVAGHVLVIDGGQTANITIKAGETAVQYTKP